MSRIRDSVLYKNVTQGKDSKFKARLLKELTIVKKAKVEVFWDSRWLDEAFVFRITPQGHDFWWNVYDHGEFPQG